MRVPHLGDALSVLEHIVEIQGERVPVEKWHGVPTEGKPDLVSIEVRNVHFVAPMPNSIDELRAECAPNLPWADDHFHERVGGIPLNPGEEYKHWPWYREGSEWDEQFRYDDGRFTHTYMERFWCRRAPQPVTLGTPGEGWADNLGIRYRYGDLDDLVYLLRREPLTRQAFLPVWFPEDTGAVHEGRVPCTIGYHFMLRDGFELFYTIRSCDVVRYLRDDVYMACRLARWVLHKLQRRDEYPWGDVKLGNIYFHAFSLHKFEGDRFVRS